MIARAALFALVPAALVFPQSPSGIEVVPASRATIHDDFWSPRIDTSRTRTIPHALDRCADRIRNLERAAGTRDGGFEGPYPFDDSDLFKVVEGIANHLALREEDTLRERLDAITAAIAAAQEEDGYLYTARQLDCERLHDWFGDERWGVLSRSHELYNLGHLIEAAVAHFEATGTRDLLDVAVRAADRIDADFGPDARRDTTGHPELEIALVRLWRATGEDRYLELARFFLDQRGRTADRTGYGEYAQDHLPVTEQREAVGHAVRGAYLYAGMADVAAATGDEALGVAVDALWEDVVRGKLYVTGGIGARGAGEAFGAAFELPNANAYCETCAAIGLANWAHSMFQRTAQSGPIDVLERALYNNVLSGVALDGEHFFYPNPLTAHRGEQRREWYACACCPTNLARFVPAVGRFAYATRGDTELLVNLYVDSEARVSLGDHEVSLDVDTRYPWDGAATIRVDVPTPVRFSLCLRIPGWARETPVPSELYEFDDRPAREVWIDVDGDDLSIPPEHGYAVLTRTWQGGESVRIHLPMPVRRLRAHDAVEADRGRFALQRGPVVYCVEGIDVADSDGSATALVVAPDATFRTETSEMLGGCVIVTGAGRIARRSLEGEAPELGEPVSFRAIPYALRAHREPSTMTVWIATEPAFAEPAPAPTLARRSRATASFHEELVGALSDQLEVSESADKSRPHFHLWPRKGSVEWVGYEFPAPAEVTGVEVFWMADVPRGECDLPASWRLLWRDGEEWRPVELHGERYPLRKDAWNRVEFAPVSTGALRLEVTLREGLSAGIHEWRVLATRG